MTMPAEWKEPPDQSRGKMPATFRSYLQQSSNREDNGIEDAKSLSADLYARTEVYKSKWDKNGTVQFKNDRIAILQRAWGRQVQFIIAFDDLTKEGYELKAIDGGKEIDSGSGMGGGMNSYYYFQKIGG